MDTEILSREEFDEMRHPGDMACPAAYGAEQIRLCRLTIEALAEALRSKDEALKIMAPFCAVHGHGLTSEGEARKIDDIMAPLREKGWLE